jgi:ribose 5-phosphate isomerase B
MAERLVIAADHGGVLLKRELLEGLKELNVSIEDLGAYTDEVTDYPDYAHAVAQAIQLGKFDRGILLCGTGVGMAMTANRYDGVRAVNCSDTFTARYSRLHNNSNVLCLGGRVVGFGLAWDIVSAWLSTAFSADGRHVRRVNKIERGQTRGQVP